MKTIQIAIILAAVAVCNGRSVRSASPSRNDLNWHDPERLAGMIAMADTNRNGTVELDEHMAFFRSMHGMHRMSPWQLRSLFYFADNNPKDNVLSPEELVEFSKVACVYPTAPFCRPPSGVDSHGH